jgi:anti-sigma-K factor RskA
MLVLVAWLVSTLGTVERQAAQLAEVENRLTEMQGQVNIPPGNRTVALAPTSEYTGVSALVIFNPDSSEVWLVADGLQPLPEDLIYELWIIRPPGQGQSEVGGVFGPTETGTAVHRTAAQGKIADYAGFAVSIERKPGVPVREGPVVVVGRFEEQ